MKNKNILIGLAVATGVVLAIVIHRRNKSLKDKSQKPQKQEVVNEVKEEVMTTEKDAISFMEKMRELGFFVRLSPDKRKAFTKEYVKEVSKSEHDKVMGLLSKPRGQWTMEEVFFYEDNFLNTLLMPDSESQKDNQ
jgi:hypothetical protein